MAMRFREQQERSRAATHALVALFAVTVLLTVLGVNAALALAWRLQFGGFFGYPRWFFETNTALTLGFVLGGAWLETLQLGAGGAYVAKSIGGRELVTPDTLAERRLRNIVDEVAIAAGLKPPRLFVLDGEAAINALAAGWEADDSVIAVTRGALERLTRDELQGVVAHEFAHILQGDTRLNMRLIGMVYGLQMVSNFGRSLMQPGERGGRPPTWLVGAALLVAGGIGWLAGRLLKAGVSREREHLADAAAVQFTRQPDGLGNALRKIATQLRRGERMRHVNAEVVSHLLLASDTGAMAGWLATHPPIEERVRRIFGRDMPPLPDDPLPEQEEAAAAELAPLPFTTGLAVTQEIALEPAAAEAQLAALCEGAPAATLDAALLACLLPAGSAAGAAVHDHDHDRDQATLGRARDAVQSLALARRLPWFERLAGAAAALPHDRRAAIVRAARELVGADGRVGLGEYLRICVLQRLLQSAEAAAAAQPAPLSLDQLGDTIASVQPIWRPCCRRQIAHRGLARCCGAWGFRCRWMPPPRVTWAARSAPGAARASAAPTAGQAVAGGGGWPLAVHAGRGAALRVPADRHRRRRRHSLRVSAMWRRRRTCIRRDVFIPTKGLLSPAPPYGVAAALTLSPCHSVKQSARFLSG